MPIRTNRGRAAVYRAVWGWPLRSPRHLAVSVIVLAVLGAGVAAALPDDSTPAGLAGASAAPTTNPFDPESRAQLPGADPAAPSPSAGPGPAAGTTSAPPVPGAAPDAALAVADAWVRAFLTAPDGITSAEWTAQLRPYTTDEALPELETVDPANIPEAQVTGTPRTISSADGSAEIDVPTSAVRVRLLVISTPDGWRVASYQRAD